MLSVLWLGVIVLLSIPVYLFYYVKFRSTKIKRYMFHATGFSVIMFIISLILSNIVNLRETQVPPGILREIGPMLIYLPQIVFLLGGILCLVLAIQIKDKKKIT